MGDMTSPDLSKLRAPIDVDRLRRIAQEYADDDAREDMDSQAWGESMPPWDVLALLDSLAAARAECERLTAKLTAVTDERNAMRQAAPVMMTVLAWLNDEADGRGLCEVALHYTENVDHDHLALWLDEYKATRKAGTP